MPFASPEEAREAARKSAEARRLKRQQEAVDAEDDPRAILRDISKNKKFPAYARTQAAKAWALLGEPEEESSWRNSVQVRPDFQPPSWDEVRRVMEAAGI